jgi:N-acetylglucosaminyldiphosphoundecaprenol N-acetyl-beta-D-mannosaminyltransferase
MHDPSDPEEPALAMVFGLPFHQTTMSETLRDCAWAIESSREPCYITTPNMDHCRQCFSDASLRDLMFRSHRLLCDGMPLVWLSRWFGVPLSERVAGSDLIPRLIAQCAEKGHSLYFFGSDESTLQRACKILHERHPTLNVKGIDAPPMGTVDDWDNEALVAKLQEAKPDVLLVALGCPKQEIWCRRFQKASGVPLALGIGASLDFIAGKQTRAPRWLQKIGLEWFWRLCGDPARLTRRYAANWCFLIRMFARQVCLSNGSQQKINYLENDRRILVNGAELSQVSSRHLSQLASDVRSGKPFCILHPHPRLLKAMRRLRLDTQFPTASSPDEAETILSGQVLEAAS